jgi:hypothetical protein
MKGILFLIAFAALLLVAYATKPDDKTCIIAAVEAVWGKRTPDKYDKPTLYEQFMDLNSKQVEIDDWIFMKRIRYHFPTKEYNIGIGAFKHVFINK